MSKAELNKVSCVNCGGVLDPSWAHLSPRPPCPICGKTGIAVHVGIATEIDIAGSIDVVMQPQRTVRGWCRRWIELESEWTNLDRPITETMSGNAINSAHHRLQSFFIQLYHLKDTLISDPKSGLSKTVVESAISTDPRLALLADLANLDKHSRLTRPPRSSDVPVIGSAKGQAPGSGGGWRLRLEIIHQGRTRDGLDVAGEAMDAWRNQLHAWGII